MATARGCFRHVAQVMCEIPILVRKSPQAVEKKWVRWHGVEHIDKARAKGKGVFILTGHIGNWEWTAVTAGMRIGPAVLVARPVDWPPAERLVELLAHQKRTPHGAQERFGPGPFCAR